MRSEPIRGVVDTNVVFEGLTKRDTAAGWIIEAWLADLFRPCVSNALAYEYVETLSSKLSPERWRQVRPVLHDLLRRAESVTVYFSWRPFSQDPGDEHVIDCGMNAGAMVVTWNVGDFRQAQSQLGLPVSTPVQFLQRLREATDSSDA
jgi:predicted nucleic acid-binding protein